MEPANGGKLNVRDCLCHNTRRTARLLSQFYDLALRPSGLRIPQFTMMATLDEMGAPSVVPLAKFLGMDRTTLARNVELMAREGLVEVHPGTEDRRQQMVKLTAKGAEMLAKAKPLWERAQGMAWKQLQAGAPELLLAQLRELAEIG